MVLIFDVWLAPESLFPKWADSTLLSAWFVVLVAAFSILWIVDVRWKRAAKRAGGKLCTRCGFDMTAHDDGAICPECGTEFDEALSIQTWRNAWSDTYVDGFDNPVPD